MKKTKHDLSGLSPVESYDAPELPKLQDARNDPALMKELPSRWKNNARVIACMGLVGAWAIALSSCIDTPHHGGAGGAPNYVATPTEQDASKDEPEYVPPDDRPHHGGAGYVPGYVVQATEQEVAGMVRAHLEAAGLDFSADPPGYFVSLNEWSTHPIYRDIGLVLFNEDIGIAIAFVSEADTWGITVDSGYLISCQDLADLVEEAFSQQTSDIQVRVFFLPDNYRFIEFGADDPGEDKANEELVSQIERLLVPQVEDFLGWLQAEGIIAPIGGDGDGE